MGELQPSKRRRVYAFEPDEGAQARFLHKYVNYLLPALTNTLATFQENKDQEKEEMVRFEVDMALVLSANGFAWSHALKHKLERKMKKVTLKLQTNTTPKYKPTSTNLFLMCKCNGNGNLDQLSPLPPLERPLLRNPNPNPNPHPSCKKSKRKKRREEEEEEGQEELGWRLRTLRRLLPGGNVMGMGELFPELENYIVCLKLQVSILGTLVDSHRA